MKATTSGKDSSTKYLNSANLYKLDITKVRDRIEVLEAGEIPSQKLFTFTLPQDWQRKYKVRAVGSEKLTVDSWVQITCSGFQRSWKEREI